MMDEMVAKGEKEKHEEQVRRTFPIKLTSDLREGKVLGRMSVPVRAGVQVRLRSHPLLPSARTRSTRRRRRSKRRKLKSNSLRPTSSRLLAGFSAGFSQD